MKATVLVDNIKGCGLNGEWGLCVYIEYDDKTVLLDTGASDLFVKNAEQLGLDLAKVDFAVLSHAHFDHADGMKSFFAVNDRAPFYLQKAAGENCYEKFWVFSKYIGIPRGILREAGERIRFAEGKFQICPGVWLLPHTTPGLEAVGRRNHMYLRDDCRCVVPKTDSNGRRGNRRWRPDDFSHEQSLVFETVNGLVIFNSCSHGGADNIIREVQEALPGKKIKAIVGGFHLYTRKANEVRELARSIKATGIEQVYTGHCTGHKAFDILKDELGDMVHSLSCGLVMDF
ncbi:MAG: MBL fold metallo-hydrolase [Firmicutes bacterium]|nr:MBL fold metallo-hydrolase [Bacillota bacterium]